MKTKAHLKHSTRYPATHSDIIEMYLELKSQLEEQEAGFYQASQELKDDIQKQLHDIFNEIRSLRKELIYFESREGDTKKIN